MTDPALVHQRDRVEITVPLETRFISTLRVLAASLAADVGFSVDEIDDMRLAISEVFSMMTAEEPGRRLTASFVVDGDSLHVDIAGDGATSGVQPDDLARNILDAVVDSYRFEPGSVTLTKRAVEARSA
jgi:serine/threonine-protein kinase RsbW